VVYVRCHTGIHRIKSIVVWFSFMISCCRSVYVSVGSSLSVLGGFNFVSCRCCGCCAAVLIGRITGLAHPSVRPSVRPSRTDSLTRKRKSVEKPKLVCTFPGAGVTGVAFFS